MTPSFKKKIVFHDQVIFEKKKVLKTKTKNELHLKSYDGMRTRRK